MLKKLINIFLAFFIFGCTIPDMRDNIYGSAVKITGYGIYNQETKKSIETTVIENRNVDVLYNVEYLVVDFQGEISIIFKGPGLYEGSGEPLPVSRGTIGEASLLIEKGFVPGLYEISILSAEQGNILASVKFKVI